MNISTNTLLNMLNPGLSNVVLKKVDDATVDGKVNLGNVVKDKTIQSLFTGLFKDISNGTQNKQQVLNLLQNSQQSLNFKTLSSDVKSLLNTVQNNPTLNTTLSNQVSSLQNSLLDLGKIDFNSLKTSLNNSGIFLESKLLGHNAPLSKALTTTIQNLSNLINSMVTKGSVTESNISMIQKQIDMVLVQQNLSDEMVSSTKNMAGTLLKDISLLQNSLKSDTQNMQGIQKLISSLESFLSQSGTKNDLLENIKTLFNTNQKLHDNVGLKEMVQTHLQQIRIDPNISHDIKLEVKNAVENLLRQANMFQEQQFPLSKNNMMEAERNIMKLQQTLQTLPLSANIKEETISGLKEIFQTLDTSKIQATQVQQVQTSLQQITTNNTVPNDIKLEIKNAVENLLRQASFPTASKQISFQQNLTQTIQKGVDTLEQNLLQQGFKNDATAQIKGLLLNSFDQVNLKSELNTLKTTLLVLHSNIDQNISDKAQKEVFKEQLQNLLTQYKSVSSIKTVAEQLPSLNNFLQNLKGFENKLDGYIAAMKQQNIIPKEIANDLKAIVSQVQKEIEKSNDPSIKELKALVDRIGSQIDYFQLLSYTSNSSHTYLSFLQDSIEDADIKFHKSNEDTFSCQINLSLKEKGDVKILLILDKEVNLGVTIGVGDDNFKKSISSNLQDLRQGLNQAGLLLQSLNIFDLEKNSSQTQKVHSYQGDDHASFGVDLKA